MTEKNGAYSFTQISELGEFGLIDKMQSVLGPSSDSKILQGIGDDAAVYAIGDGRVHVITSDVLIERVHFDRTFMPYRYLGYKSISVNVSDIVAMNAKPLYAVVSLGIPSNVSVEMIEELYLGFKQACDDYDMNVVGGDTSGSDRLVINVTLVGEAPEERIVRRIGAEKDDLICVSGRLGGAYAGLKLLISKKEEFQEADEGFDPGLTGYDEVVKRQLMPSARIDIYRGLADLDIIPSSMIDISDGLASELNHLDRMNPCGFEVVAFDIPIHDETRRVAEEMAEDAETFALFGGEDYELLFTVRPEHEDAIKSGDLDLRIIGKCVSNSGVRLEVNNGELINIDDKGYQHF